MPIWKPFCAKQSFKFPSQPEHLLKAVKVVFIFHALLARAEIVVKPELEQTKHFGDPGFSPLEAWCDFGKCRSKM